MNEKASVQFESNFSIKLINTAISIVDKAMRLVGAKSLQRKNPLQRYYRDVRAGLHNPPMDDLTIQNLAQTAIKQMKVDKGI